MFDYGALEAVVAARNAGTLDRAAKQLGLTASAVSQKIKRAEAFFGKPLIVRTTPIKPTRFGEKLIGHYERVRLMEQGFSTEADTSPFTTLSIATNSESLSVWFVENIADVCKKHRVLLDMVIEDEKKTSQMLQETRVMACVSSDPQAPSGCESHRLGELRYRFVCSPEFKAQYFPRGLSKEALMQAPTAVFGVFDQVHEDFVQRIFPGWNGFTTNRHLIRSPEALLKLALHGMACIVLLEPVIEKHLKSGELVDLSPGKVFRIPLFWQHYAAPNTILEDVTRDLVQRTRAVLRKS